MALTLHRKTRYPIWFAVLVAASLTVAANAPEANQVPILLGLLTFATGFIYFVYRQHLDETKLFKELFTEFNKRFDRLNARLDRIARGEVGDPSEEKGALLDYFNLCAEEFLFYKAGYIDEEVWQTWRRGMLFYANNPRIKKFWEEELRNDSSYGFRLD